mmetsp:Transcript_19747/g.44840  ORF Transcript_19747/g.44840 Transcript_19747/m.44840 type:complete len:167 (-) Transcript_19747:64-564(-)
MKMEEIVTEGLKKLEMAKNSEIMVLEEKLNKANIESAEQCKILSRKENILKQYQDERKSISKLAKVSFAVASEQIKDITMRGRSKAKNTSSRSRSRSRSLTKIWRGRSMSKNTKRRQNNKEKKIKENTYLPRMEKDCEDEYFYSVENEMGSSLKEQYYEIVEASAE